jgi:hypothetical protein
MRSWKVVGSVILAGALSLWAAPPNQAPLPNPQQAPQQAPQGPQPGMVNYIEGQVSIGGQPLAQKSVGSAQVQAGQSLTTQAGRAELLLTPGVLLRLNGGSSLLMNSPDLANTAVTLQGGRAMVEADQILKENRIVIQEGPASVRLMTNGLYDFDAMSGQIRVFDGRAEVTLAGKTFTVQGGHEFDLNTAKLKARGFDKTAYEDDFYRWGSLRSSYLAEANVDAARGFAQGYYGPSYAGPAYAGFYGYGPSGYGDGWFWDPYFSAYTWLPGDGIFFNPFGWGFYSPAFVFRAPFYGYRGVGGYHAFGPSYRAPVAAQGFANHGFAGGATAAHVGGAGFAGGGGFHGGGGGGFHGGGGGGRR